MEGNVELSRVNEEYTLAEVGQQIDITEEIPNEHDKATFHFSKFIVDGDIDD